MKTIHLLNVYDKDSEELLISQSSTEFSFPIPPPDTLYSCRHYNENGDCTYEGLVDHSKVIVIEDNTLGDYTIQRHSVVVYLKEVKQK